MDYYTNPETNQALSKWIHDKFGRGSGLIKEDYYIHIDHSLKNGMHGGPCDVAIYAGATIHIWIRFGPQHGDAFVKCLKGVFEETRIKQFLRSKMMTRKSDAVKWYSLERTFVGLPEINPKVKIRHIQTDVITAVRVKDTKTNREEIVSVINGDSFSAQQEALHRLCGGKLD